MKDKIFILVVMIFCHIVDDYYLQGWLASAKQKVWWKNNAPDKRYRFDYLAALFMHSFSWSFMVMIVPTIYIGSLSVLLFIANVITHMIVDDAKANRKKLNLIQDQCIHLAQIVWTWYVVALGS